MRVPFLLAAPWLLSLLLPVLRLRAQGRPLGPWRVVNQTVRKTNDNDGWGSNNTDTTTYLVAEKRLIPVRWDVEPNSIRLFINCENFLLAPPPPRKGQPAVRFSATGATVQLNAKTKRLLIVPSDSVVTLWAYRGPALVFKHAFKAVPPPAPTLACYYGGQQPTDLKPGEKWQRSLTLKAIPDAQFSAFLPDDARYRVSLYQVTFLRNDKPIQPTKTIRGPQSEIGNPKDYRSGDQLRVQVQAVQRMNFRGDIEVLPLHKQFILPVQFIEY